MLDLGVLCNISPKLSKDWDVMKISSLTKLRLNEMTFDNLSSAVQEITIYEDKDK